MKAIAKKELFDQDFMTQAALGYKNIPKGAVVEVKEEFQNFYGRYIRVEYNDRVYDVKQCDLKFCEE